MKFWIKCLIGLAAVLISLALYDTVYNGLLGEDGYNPVTEQMKDVIGK